MPTEVKDTWANKFAPDGSFARCYIDLQQFEDQITGKASQFDLNCFNEWETMSNGNQPMKRGKPYKIAQLEVKCCMFHDQIQEKYYQPALDPHMKASMN